MTGSLKPEIRRVKPENFRLLFSAFLISVFCLLAFAPAAQANCASPVGIAGHIINNAAYNVLQYCDGTNWIAMGPHGAGGSGIVGWWKLDESSGPTATDSSGNGHNGTWTNGPAYTASGKINGALTFTGPTEYVDVPDAGALDMAGSWAVGPVVLSAVLRSSGG